MERFFFGEKQIFLSWNYSPQMPDYQDFQIIGHMIIGILLYIAEHKICIFYCQVPENASYLAFNCTYHAAITITVHVLSVCKWKEVQLVTG